MEVMHVEHLAGLIEKNWGLILVAAGAAVVGMFAAIGALFYARKAYVISVITLERVSQEQTARLNAMMRAGTDVRRD